MSKLDRMTVFCRKCNEEIDATLYTSVNAQLDPGYKKKILRKKLFEVKCPNCNCVQDFYYPVLYNDMENLLMIKFSLEDKLLAFDFIQKQDIIDSFEEYKKAISMYKVIGSSTKTDFASKVTLTDLGLDIKAAYITAGKQIKENTKGVLLQYINPELKQKGGKLVIEYLIQGKKKSLDFDYGIYEKLLSESKGELDELYDFLFDFQSAVKYIYASEKSDEEKNELRKRQVTFAEVEDRDGRLFIAQIPEFLKEKPVEGDLVFYGMDGFPVIVRGIYSMSVFSAPFMKNPNVTPVMMVLKPHQYTELSEDTRLDNEILEKFLHTGEVLDTSKLMLSQVYMNIWNENKEKILVSAIGESQGEMQSDFTVSYEDSNLMASVYLSKEEAEKDSAYGEPTKMSLIDAVLYSVASGIMPIGITFYKEGKMGSLPYCYLFTRFAESLLGYGELRRILANLSFSEMEYFGRDNYKVMLDHVYRNYLMDKKDLLERNLNGRLEEKEYLVNFGKELIYMLCCNYFDPFEKMN